MNKLYRILGKRGRITIPYEIRRRVGFQYNDVLSFTEKDDRAVVVRREKICDNCKGTQPAVGKQTDGITLLQFLDGLSADEQRAALIHLSVKWAEHQTINAGNHTPVNKQCKGRELNAGSACWAEKQSGKEDNKTSVF